MLAEIVNSPALPNASPSSKGPASTTTCPRLSSSFAVAASPAADSASGLVPFGAVRHSAMAERFAAADTDSDGRWNQAEYVAHRLEPFAKVDTDGDGNITAAEQEAAKAKMKEKRGKWRDKPADQ